MARTDANPPMMPYTDEYTLVEVDADYLTKAVKPKQFIHIDQTECIMCEGCVDICPWKCIHMVQPSAISEAVGTEQSMRTAVGITRDGGAIGFVGVPHGSGTGVDLGVMFDRNIAANNTFGAVTTQVNQPRLMQLAFRVTF